MKYFCRLPGNSRQPLLTQKDEKTKKLEEKVIPFPSLDDSHQSGRFHLRNRNSRACISRRCVDPPGHLSQCLTRLSVFLLTESPFVLHYFEKRQPEPLPAAPQAPEDRAYLPPLADRGSRRGLFCLPDLTAGVRTRQIDFHLKTETVFSSLFPAVHYHIVLFIPAFHMSAHIFVRLLFQYHVLITAAAHIIVFSLKSSCAGPSHPL